ncbi:MAG: hypothetical protein IJP31_04805 [Lachnospiraceae bacterium]|nr:hypothetical protein [Lachnospiraceae bacterium]
MPDNKLFTEKIRTIFSHRYVQNSLCVLGAILTVFSLTAELAIKEGEPCITSHNNVSQLSFVLVLAFLYKYFSTQDRIGLEKRLKGAMCVLALLLSLLYLLGKSYHSFNEWILFLGGWKWTWRALLLWLGLFPIYYLVLSMMLKFLEQHSALSDTVGRVTRFIFEKHPVLMTMVIILICQLPYLIAFNPGTVSWDGAYQMGELMGDFDLTWHHPPFVTFLYGYFVKLSKHLGNDNTGILIFIILQSLLSAFSFGTVFGCLKKLKTPYWMRYALLAFFALFTVWPIHAITMIKDSLFYPLTVLYFCLCLNAVLEPEIFWKKKPNYVWILIVVILMCLIRHNGMYMFLLSFPFMVLLAPKWKKIVGLVLLLSIVLTVNYINNHVWSSMGVGTKNKKEDTFSVMVQQSARYALYHGDEVTEEEYAVLNEVFEYANLPEAYNPEISDPVKDQLKGIVRYISTNTEDYLEVWLQQGLKHPATYIQSFLNGCFGYFYPEREELKEGLGWYSSAQIYSPEHFQLTYSESMADLRLNLEELAYTLRDIPGVGILYSCGIYTWGLLFVIAALLALKNKKLLIPCLPAAINVLVCMASPVNAYLRYALPTFAMVPVLFCWMVYWIKEEKNTQA